MVDDGDLRSLDVSPELFAALRAIAEHRFRSERPGHLLQPTALVNEAVMRMARRPGGWTRDSRVLAHAGDYMRRVLIDHARSERAGKRGGHWRRIDLSGTLSDDSGDGTDILELEDALARFAELDPRAARVVELRFFAGLAETEVATLLGVSRRTVQEDWRAARAWFQRELCHRD